MKEQALKSLGLTDKEVKIYLSNLQMGSALVQNIANFAKLNRTSAYDLLKSLEQKGFVSYTIQSGKKFYQATQPNKLIAMLKEREALVQKILPELNSISSSVTKRPKVEVYTGKDGIKTIFENILQESKSFSCMASKEHLLKLFEYYLPHFVDRRKKKGIKVKLISETQPIDKTAEYKLIKNKIKTATWLYNGKIAMISLEEKELIGILINEKNFYDTYKLMFDLLWENL
ncbi:helix-turn-helix transcriptional regulator [Candidatus Pacearchaeota archaeon]|nr:helix-turn-helix transcriptional regulator [Candidatus Pacearchaeota archaeon]